MRDKVDNETILNLRSDVILEACYHYCTINCFFARLSLIYTLIKARISIFDKSNLLNNLSLMCDMCAGSDKNSHIYGTHQ